jgi:superkiller protein 3
VLYLLGRLEAAIERFRQAVELDPEYAEAWNNLGNALAEAGRIAGAIYALRQALEIAPHYADAHYSLAEALEEHGRCHEAQPHWKAYLRQEAVGERADYARHRLLD